MTVISKVNSLVAGSAAMAAAAFVGAGVAQADGYERAGAYRAAYNWSGFYFGLHSGYEWSDIKASFPVAGVNPALQIAALPGGGFEVDHGAPIVGGQIGLQYQFGQAVIGVEGSLSSAFRNNFSPTLCPRTSIANFDCVARFDDVISIGPRLGWSMGRWMPYVTGGYATEGWSAEARNRSLAPGATTIIEWGNGRNSGWFVGGGVDWAVAGGWTVGFDYRHYDFGENLELARAVVGGVWGPLPNDNAVFRSTVDTVSLRVNWKFGREVVEPLK